LGYEIKRGIASREEMEKTERMGGATADDRAIKCPECGESKAVIKGKAEYGGGYLCFKKKGGCGAKWEHLSEPATMGYGPDQIERDKLFNQAEQLLAKLPEEKRKEKLGNLVKLSTEEMGKKVNELAENARKKSGVNPDVLRQFKVDEIRRNYEDSLVAEYLNEHFKGKALEDLSLDALVELAVRLDEKVPF
jgi:hypothetical protein